MVVKELFAAFNADFFRALATLIIPGSIALSTWAVDLALRFEQLRALVSSNHIETAFVLFLLVVFVGLVIEDIGSRIEARMDGRADRATNGQHTKDWYLYLKTAFVCEAIGRRYIRTLVTRLKFELGTSVGLLIADMGVVVLYVDGFLSLWALIVPLALTFVLAGYLGLVEARSSHRLLAKARTEMLGDIRIVKG
ncbi:MAG: hypothetical protein ACM3WP_05210 [Acidobacteriota bacterium]